MCFWVYLCCTFYINLQHLRKLCIFNENRYKRCILVYNNVNPACSMLHKKKDLSCSFLCNHVNFTNFKCTRECFAPFMFNHQNFCTLCITMLIVIYRWNYILFYYIYVHWFIIAIIYAQLVYLMHSASRYFYQ